MSLAHLLQPRHATGGDPFGDEDITIVVEAGVVKKKSVNRGNPKTWVNGKFVHPHDACFDNDGNILVAEWVATGRITRLKRVS